MMKRETNNSRQNLDANTSVLSNKSRTNASTINAPSNQQRQNIVHTAQSKFATQPPPQQQNFVQ